MKCPEETNLYTQALRRGGWGVAASEYGASHWGGENVLELDTGDACRTL